MTATNSPSTPGKIDGTIIARIFKPILEKYAEDEIAALPKVEQFHARRGAMKAFAREDLDEIDAVDRNELKEKIIELTERHQPAPLLVKLNTTLDNT